MCVSVVLYSVPAGASAQGLVPCGDDRMCTWQDLLILGENVINWLVAFLAVAAVFLFMLVGFQLVTSGGNPVAWQRAKQTFTKVVLGILLVLGAALIVDTVLRAISGRGIDGYLGG